MKPKSITGRFLRNSLSVIIAILAISAIVFYFSLRNFYYQSARQAVTSRANIVSSILSRIMSDDTINFNVEVRNVIENSEEKNRMEINAIDHTGKIVLSSSGFSYTLKPTMPDYTEALQSANGMGYYVGKSSSFEKIMAISVAIPYINGEYSAIRYVVSLEKINRQLMLYMLTYLVVSVLIIAIVFISGIYFVKSIVQPVRELGIVARQLATGEMSSRIVKKSNDEIGELCDIINYMADEMQASEQMKNEFISSVSHELRTPLTAIKGWSETLTILGKEDGDTLKKGMRVITSETQRLSVMVEELLDFSRMQSGKLTLVKAKIDILAELEEAILIYSERAKRDNIDIVYNEPDMLPFIFGDKNRLKQVFINIIDNALKYSDADGVVTIKATEKDGYINIIVSDTGCGIAGDDMPKIKQKFYKANLTRRGSGIGLAVADEIISLHNGELVIESELNVGTVVTINIPINLKKGEERQTEISTTQETSTIKDDM